jgi:hypothetical protein
MDGDVGGYPRADAEREKHLRRVQRRLEKLDRALGWSSLERADSP